MCHRFLCHPPTLFRYPYSEMAHTHYNSIFLTYTKSKSFLFVNASAITMWRTSMYYGLIWNFPSLIEKARLKIDGYLTIILIILHIHSKMKCQCKKNLKENMIKVCYHRLKFRRNFSPFLPPSPSSSFVGLTQSQAPLIFYLFHCNGLCRTLFIMFTIKLSLVSLLFSFNRWFIVGGWMWLV